MSDLIAKPKGSSSSGIQWIEVLQPHNELIIIFPEGDKITVQTKDAAKTVIRHWVREAHNARSVRVMWPKSHETIWAMDI